LVGCAFLVLVVIAGTVASDVHRRNAGTTGSTTTTMANLSSTSSPAQAAGTDACTGDNFVTVLQATGYVTPSLLLDLRPERVKCIDGYAYVFLDVARPADEQASEAYFRMTNGHWHVIDVGAVGSVGDGTTVGLPAGLGARLRSA
jgi:hypothetical protein